MNDSETLVGLDGSNPLAFLAAIGTLRVLDLQLPRANVKLHWKTREGAWRPVISCAAVPFDQATIVETLTEYLASPPQLPLLEEIGPDLTISGARLRHLGMESLAASLHDPEGELRRRVSADYVVAFGCDAITADNDPDSQIEDTAFRTMSGAGHQHFIKFMRDIIAATDASHLRASLFEPWTYNDSGRGLNLRWDPADDRRYALRWKNPSTDPNTTMRGANRLAIEALPLFPTAPAQNALQTTGFTRRRRLGVRWTWPIWTSSVNIDTCRSILQLAAVQPPPPTEDATALDAWRAGLERRGIAAVFQSQRITTGKFRNFTPANPW